MEKYRVKEVAADFGMQPKQIAQIMEKFFEKPKSNTQVLTDEELNVIFDYITQTNQIESIEVVFAVAPAPKKEQPKAEVKEEKKEDAPAKEEKKESAPPKPEKPAKPAEPERKRERRVVDTSAVQLNTRRFRR